MTGLAFPLPGAFYFCAAGHYPASGVLSRLGSRRKGPKAAFPVSSKTTRLVFNIFKVDRNLTFTEKKAALSRWGGALPRGKSPSCLDLGSL